MSAPLSSPTSLATNAAAFFDVDGTLVRSTIAHYYAYFRRSRMMPGVSTLWYWSFVAKCGYYILLDKVNRNTLNVVFYRQYRDLPANDIKARAKDCHRYMVQPKIFEQAPSCIEEHREARRRIVFVTGSLDFVMAPLAEELSVDHMIAASLEERDGRFTGSLRTAPIAGQEKAHRIRQYADKFQIDLAESFAYGDSIADLPMLEAVGHPHAVNPDKSLAQLAASRGWPIHRWSVRPQPIGASH